MLVVISPAKKLDFETQCPHSMQSKPPFLTKTNSLAKELKKLTSEDIGKLMKLSANLSNLNFERFQSFKNTSNNTNTKQAAFAFNGDTYTGLDITSLNEKEIEKAQKKLRILSGLYGILKPMDLIQPYRLEMGTRYKFKDYKNLYDYWKADIAAKINEELDKDKLLVNCASQEYFGAVDLEELKAKVIIPVFKENKNGVLKVISFNAKRARGMMARFIIQNDINDIEKLKTFNDADYTFNSKLSSETELVFTR